MRESKVKAEDLRDALKKVSWASQKTGKDPILRCVMIKALYGYMSITCTDLINRASAVISTDSHARWCVCVGVDELIASLRGMRGDLTITIGGCGFNSMSISSSHGIFVEMAVLQEEKFPKWANTYPEDSTIRIGMSEWRSIAKTVGFAMNKSSYRPYLAGIFFHQSQGVMVADASDGCILARRVMTCDLDGDWSPAIIRSDTVKGLTKAIGRMAGKMSICHCGSYIAVYVDNMTVFSTPISMSYPDFDHIIPEDSPVSAIWRTNDLAEALSATKVKMKDVIVINVGEGRTSITNASAWGHKIVATVQPILLGVNELSVALNRQYLADAISAFGGATCVSMMRDKNDQMKTVWRSDDKPGYTVVIAAYHQ